MWAGASAAVKTVSWTHVASILSLPVVCGSGKTPGARAWKANRSPRSQARSLIPKHVDLPIAPERDGAIWRGFATRRQSVGLRVTNTLSIPVRRTRAFADPLANTLHSVAYELGSMVVRTAQRCRTRPYFREVDQFQLRAIGAERLIRETARVRAATPDSPAQCARRGLR